MRRLPAENAAQKVPDNDNNNDNDDGMITMHVVCAIFNN